MDGTQSFCIQVKNLSKSFGSHVVLDKLTLNIPKGKISYIVGRSGEGKSVTIKHLIGLLKPDSGEIYFENKPVHNATEKTWESIRKKIGTLFQDGALFDSINVSENIAFPIVNHTHTPRKEIEKRVKELLEMVELPNIGHKFSSELSIGERKRVGIARALALEPNVIFYDEPTTNMDPLISELIDNIILHNQKKIKNLTSIVISHDITSMMSVADNIFLLHKGKIYFSGTPADFQNSTDPLIKQFLSGSLNGPLDVPLV